MTTQEFPEGAPEGAKEERVPIKNDATGQSKVWPNMLEENINNLSNGSSFVVGEKECHV
jgi:hypothetical protein